MPTVALSFPVLKLDGEDTVTLVVAGLFEFA
jgi:hypothetical protein